jgi:hypothetical protein
MMNEGRPCHWTRVACAKSQRNMPTPRSVFVATPPSAEALIQAGVWPTTTIQVSTVVNHEDDGSTVSYVGIPHIPYGKNLPPGSNLAGCKLNDDMAEWLYKLNDVYKITTEIRRRYDIPSAMNLAAWLHFIAKANHESVHEIKRMSISGLPWGSLKQVPCAEPNCERCSSKLGGFEFGWQGPWTCVKVLQMDMSDIPGVDMKEHIVDVWENCAAIGGCKICLFLCDPCRQYSAHGAQQPDDRVPVNHLPYRAVQTVIEYPRRT